MKFKFCFPLTLVVFQMLYCLPLKAQSSFPDSSLLFSGANNVKNLYHRATAEHSHLYNGIEYVGYPFKLDKGHVYFDKNEWSRGSVKYDGVQYENISMMYDLNKGELVIVHLMDNLRVQLIKDKIEEFSLLGHTFRRIERDPGNPTSPVTEIYDLLYEGKITALAQRRKQILESATTSGLVRSIDDKINYYLLKDGNYHQFSTKKAFLKIFKDQQRKVKAYIRENKIKYRKDREGSIIRIAKFYDQLNP